MTKTDKAKLAKDIASTVEIMQEITNPKSLEKFINDPNFPEQVQEAARLRQDFIIKNPEAIKNQTANRARIRITGT